MDVELEDLEDLHDLMKHLRDTTGKIRHVLNKMTERTIRFAKMYDKLKHQNHFCTIRKNSISYHNSVGENYDVILPGEKRRAILIGCFPFGDLDNITTEFLVADTDCKTRADAITLMRGFYPNSYLSNMTLLIFEWNDAMDIFHSMKSTIGSYNGDSWQILIEYMTCRDALVRDVFLKAMGYPLEKLTDY